VASSGNRPEFLENKKDSPEPPETVLQLSRLEEHVTVRKVADRCCSIIANK